MKGLGNQLLPCSALSGDQDRGIAPRNIGKNLEELEKYLVFC